MKNFTVSSFAGFHELVINNFQMGCVYRGLKNEGYSLIPSLGRLLKFYEESGLDEEKLFLDEKNALELFRTECAQYVDVVPDGQLDLMALAQHHGLPTRLMDWTLNSLVALFFATENEFDGDSVVYVAPLGIPVLLRQEAGKADIGGIEEVTFFQALPHSPRMSAQNGVFSIQPKPCEEINTDLFSKITIKNEGREGIRNILFEYGVNRGILFPGLDGICSKIKHWKLNAKLK